MVSMSDLAASLLLASLKASGVTEDQGLRLVTNEGSLSMEIDSATDADRVIEHDGAKVLIIGKEVDELLGNIHIDIEDTPSGPQLVVKESDS